MIMEQKIYSVIWKKYADDLYGDWKKEGGGRGIGLLQLKAKITP